MLILYIGLQFSFFKISGYIPWTQSVAGALSTLILPALTIAIPQIAVNFRYVRTAILEQVRSIMSVRYAVKGCLNKM